jgi:membrane protein required for colicin V production
MNALDILLVVVAGVLVLIGLAKGFVRLLVMTAALIVAFVLASRFHLGLAEHMTVLRFSMEVLRLIAYALIFLGVMLLGGLLGWMLRNLVKAAMLGWADRLAGAALGLAAAALAGALVVLPLAAYVPRGTTLLEQSKLAPYASTVADLINVTAPSDLAARYRKGIERVRKLWRGEAEPETAEPAKPGKPGAKEPQKPSGQGTKTAAPAPKPAAGR